MYDFHQNTQWYFEMQALNAEKSVIPFIEEKLKLTEDMYVLEVGCAEGGVLRAFLKRGCKGVGVELDAPRLEKAKELNKDMVEAGNVQFIAKNIYDESFETEFTHKFDLIILKDVIEHIPNQEKIIAQFKKFLKTRGYIFFGFPPFNMPFGGHQQIALSKIFSKLPYTHVLPMSVYKMLLKLFGEGDVFVEIKETGISTARFEKIIQKEGYEFVNSKQFLINPIYEYKFGIKPIVQFSFISSLPHLRDFVTTCSYYLIRV